MASIDLEKVRILVVGDSGVGKSAFVYLVAHGKAMYSASWTIGASVDVKLHEYKEGTPSQKSYFVELWDIGGSINHANSRQLFYNPVHGIILVHDLTNRKSHINLRKWLGEVLNRDSYNGHNRKPSSCDYDAEQFAGNNTPVLVVGTKMDQLDSKRQMSLQMSQIAEECLADEINLDCRNEAHLAPGTTNAVKLSRYFDKVIRRCHHQNHAKPSRTASPRRNPQGKVIERRFHTQGSSQVPSPKSERRRISLQQQPMKADHLD